jgi:hypothetical protein
MTALSGPVPSPHSRTYQEVYIENGRWYGTFRKGKYMFPIDQVSLSAAVLTSRSAIFMTLILAQG